MKRFPSGAFALLVLCGTCAQAEEPLEPPDLGRYVRWGPVRVRPTVSVSNLGYDDNVFFATGADETKQGDYRMTLSPRLEGLVLFGDRAFAVFDERLEYTVFRKYHDQNFLNHMGTARLTFPRNRIGFFTELGFTRRSDRPNSELDSRPNRRENRVGAGLILKLGWRSYAEIARFHSDWNHSDRDFPGIGTLLDRVEDGTRVRLRYRLSGSSRFTLEASTTAIDFDDPGTRRDSRETVVLPGIDFGEGGRLTGSFALGRARINARDASTPDFSGLVADGEIAYRLGSGTTVRLGGWRRVDFAVYQGNVFLLDRTAETRVIHYFNRLFGVEAGGSRGTLTFPGAGGGQDRRDRVTRYDFGLRLRLSENAMGRRVEYSLNWQRYNRDSDVPGLEQSQSVLGFGAVVGF